MKEWITNPDGAGVILLLLIALVFLLALFVLWTLLPFAVFGTKPKLDGLRDELRATNAHLAAIAALLGERPPAPPTSAPAKPAP